MPNMSYCRFQNTVADLRDCLNADEPTSIEELRARVRLYEVCQMFLGQNDLDELKDALDVAIEEARLADKES